MLHGNQVPSLCDFSRCVLSWSGLVKRCEQCLHEYGFAPVWIRTWRFRSLFILNSFPQWGQSYGLLLLCTVRLCSCRWLDWLKLLLQSEHLYGLSPVWTLMCLSRCEIRLNVFSHTWHLYGFSPLWILLCTTSSRDLVNRLPQASHSNGLSPEWLRLCTARSLLLPQHLPHAVHLYLRVWICLYRPLWDEKHFSHSVHKYSFSPVSFAVSGQLQFCCKQFVTYCTQIRPGLVIMWVSCDISTISFSL